MNSVTELFKDNLRDSHWLGEVVSSEDPKNQGRCQIRVFGKFDLLADEDLPWALPCSNGMHGQFAVPKVGDIVSVRFDNGNLYQPMYWFQVKTDQAILDKVGANGALGLVSVFYDPERMQLYWASDEGLKIIGSAGDGELQVPGLLKLYGAGGGGQEPAVLGDKNEEALNKIQAALAKSATEMANIAAQLSALAAAGTAAAAIPIFSSAPLAIPLGTVAAAAASAAANMAVAAAEVIPTIPPTKSNNVEIN